MTEPEAGSDVAALATRAVRDGADYVLDGAKHLISNAGIADFYSVFAVDRPERRRAAASPASWSRPTRPGCASSRAQVLSEPHPLGEIAFESCRVPAEQPARRRGRGASSSAWRRSTACGRRSAPRPAAWRRARSTRRSASRAAARQFGQPLADLQLVQQKLARMATDLDAARLLTYRAARELDRGAGARRARRRWPSSSRPRPRSGSSTTRCRSTAAAACSPSAPVDRLYRAVRALRIYEGTSEIQHLVIARELLRERD